MKFRTETLTEKKLVGKQLTMSFSNNRTFELWNGFMPRRNEIKNTVSNNLFSLEIFNNVLFFQNFNPAVKFQKWAAIEVADFIAVPKDMETLIIPSGLYAVFIYKGLASNAPAFFQQLYGAWLPNSPYVLDNRPHFALMGEKYKNNSPDSEEEIWVPVKLK